ncbi:MAG: tetratricopeptide repeat protein [Bdellovibrionales bacterium]|nr:tetratricopeptide repeat protein [Bdellovibrionales bacterium]
MLINARRNFALVYLAVPLFTLSSCATQELRVESNPDGADVSVIDASRAPKRIGVTPIVLTQANAPGIFKSSMQVNVTKEGYKTQSVFVPETSVSSNGQLVVQLKRDDAGFLNDAAEQVAQVQRMIFKKNYNEAERLLQESISKNPSVAVFHSLLGNVYYLQKNTSRALDSYQRAQSLEPNNVDVAKMIQKLKGIKGEENG